MLAIAKISKQMNQIGSALIGIGSALHFSYKYTHDVVQYLWVRMRVEYVTLTLFGIK